MKTPADDALDAIAEICGVPFWEYPGQVVRDVELLAEAQRGLFATMAQIVDVCAEPLDGISAEQLIGEVALGARNAIACSNDSLVTQAVEARKDPATPQSEQATGIDAFLLPKFPHATNDGEPLEPMRREIDDVTTFFWCSAVGHDAELGVVMAMTGHPGGFFGDYFPRPRMEEK